MSDLIDADQLADVFTTFALDKNPTGLSLGIDSAYELGDHIASGWLAEHDAALIEGLADSYGSAQISGLFLGRDDYTKAWLREMARRRREESDRV